MAGIFAAASAIPTLAPQLAGFTSSVLLCLLLGSGLALEIWLARVPDFAFAAWFAIGAACEALMIRTFALPFWVCLPAGMTVAAAAAVFFISPLLRMRHEIVAVVTLGFGAAAQILWSTSGAGLPVGAIPAPASDLQYQSVVAVAALAALVSWRIRHSPLALMLRAADEDETACRAVGVDVRGCRIIIVAIGAMVAGAAGCLFVAIHGDFGRADFNPGTISIMLVVAVVGGRHSQSGMMLAAILTAAIFQLVPAESPLRLLIAGTALLCWPLLRRIASTARHAARAGDVPRKEAAIEGAVE
jgi:branched-chain amino acid transport system permease protein